MRLYPFFDLVLASSIALPELGEGRAPAFAEGNPVERTARPAPGTMPPDAAGQGDAGNGCRRITFILVEDDLVPPHAQWDSDPEGAEVADMRHRRVGGSHLVRFVGVADFLIDPRACLIQCRPAPDTALTSVRHLLLDQMLPRLVGQQGRLVLHASAVLDRGRAIGFVGRSGWGKSTLAASLVCDGKTAFGDDSLLLAMAPGAGVEAIVSYRGARLWSDAVAALFGPDAPTEAVAQYTDKKRLLVTGAAATEEIQAPLCALFLLNDPVAEPSAEIAVRPVRGSNALMALIESSFLLDPRDLVAVGDQLRLASEILRAGIPVFRLAYPRVHRDLGLVGQAILECLESSLPSRGLGLAATSPAGR